MTISQTKRQARVTEWVERIQDQKSSGLTVKDWCVAQGIGEGRFYYWLKLVRELAIERSEQAAQSATLIKVEPERLPSAISPLSTVAGNQQTCIVIRHGCATVELPQGTSITAVAELLKALSAP